MPSDFEKAIDALEIEMRKLGIASIKITVRNVEKTDKQTPAHEYDAIRYYFKPERNYVAREMDKCFGTTPRSDNA